MSRANKIALALAILVIFSASSFNVSTSVCQGTYAFIVSNSKVFSLPDTNATIILLNGTSYLQSNYYGAHNSTNGLFVPEEWEFDELSTGSGANALTISAQNCNVTIRAFTHYTLNTTEKYVFDTYSWLNYTVKGAGNQTVDYTSLYNSNSSNPLVYIDGSLRPQGSGWNWGNFGITVNGASSTVSIYQESTDYEPPRNPPHLSSSNYLPTIVIVVAVILVLITIALLYSRHRKTANLKH